MKKFFVIFLGCFLVANPSFAIISSQNNSDISTKKELQRQTEKINTRRLLIANALLLTDLQKTKAKQIYNQYNKKEAALYVKLNRETKLLNNLATQKANKAETKAQKKVVVSVKKEIRSIEKSIDKEFKETLTHSQRVKYNKLKKEISVENL